MPGLFPAEAALSAGEVDHVLLGLLIVTVAVLGLVFTLLLLFCIRYRSGSRASRAGHEEKSWVWEISWTAATFIAFLALFGWGADLYLRMFEAPSNTLDIFVVGKQWMWKVQHPDGQAEINELHLPVDRNVRLIMASQDVIHSFDVPAFRIKRDLVPGRYKSVWFRPTEVGEYRLYCSEFCGLDHARMTGKIVVMSAADYARWLTAQGNTESLAASGEKLFRTLGCGGCHGQGSTVHAPDLADLYGRRVALSDGSFVTADDRYIRNSILLPSREIVAGYPDAMPSFAGQIDESQVMQLIAYIKSLHEPEGRQP